MAVIQRNVFENTVELNEAVISYDFLRKLIVWIGVWFIFFLGFIALIDPYWISPLRLEIPGINANKPERINIDRFIKPYEVWRDQPKTIFMGTSRIHQSIDPSYLENSKFAPAYNAAIPASTLAENADYLELFFKLDPGIKNVFIELFLYNFTGQEQISHKRTVSDFFKNSLSLHFSTDALLSSLKTFYLNAWKKPLPSYIEKKGFRVPAKNFNPEDTFEEIINIRTVLSLNRNHISLHLASIESLNRIVALTKKHGAELYLLLTPNYPWDDYRQWSLGNWSVIEEWIRHLSQYKNVLSFSQYNPVITEEVGPNMQWWNDPTHFSLNTGHLMLKTILQQKDKIIPANFMLPINPGNVEEVIKQRSNGLKQWMRDNPYAEKFEDAKTMLEPPEGSLDVLHQRLIVNGVTHHIIAGVGEVAFTKQRGNTLAISGWAIDEINRKHIKQIIVTQNSEILGQGFPSVRREDINKGLGTRSIASGFYVEVPVTENLQNNPIRVFAIRKDDYAVQLTTQDSVIDGVPVGSLGRKLNNFIIFNSEKYPIVQREAGNIETITKIKPGYQMAGWAIDVKANNSVKAIFVAVDSKIVAKSLPTIERKDIVQYRTNSSSNLGFNITIPIPQLKRLKEEEITVYALMEDKVVVPLVLKEKQ